MFSSKRILVPVDGSDAANKALTAALQMARTSGGRVRVIYVVDELAYLTGFEHTAAVMEQVHEQAQKLLDDAAAICHAAGVGCDTRLVEGPGQRLGDVVADEAGRWEADLVVIGTHGRRGVERLLLGSGAEQVIRLAPVPVLVVRDRVVLR